MTDEQQAARQEIIEIVKLRLGEGLVDVELDPAHFDMALDMAIRKYRQRAANSVEESHMFLELGEEQQDYILPQEIMQVRQVFRRTIGSANAGSANQFEPFEAGYLNAYMLVTGRVGGLATYEIYTQYQELSARMFGGFLNFTWNPVTKKITIVRKIRSTGEVVLLWTYNYKPEVMLLRDYMAQPWFIDYTLAMCKFTLGEARSKFATIAGPQGGSQLNGDTLKSEAKEELDKLEQQLLRYTDGSTPLTWVIG